jgi:hypothetical protein
MCTLTCNESTPPPAEDALHHPLKESQFKSGYQRFSLMNLQECTFIPKTDDDVNFLTEILSGPAMDNFMPPKYDLIRRKEWQAYNNQRNNRH